MFRIPQQARQNWKQWQFNRAGQLEQILAGYKNNDDVLIAGL